MAVRQPVSRNHNLFLYCLLDKRNAITSLRREPFILFFHWIEDVRRLVGSGHRLRLLCVRTKESLSGTEASLTEKSRYCSPFKYKTFGAKVWQTDVRSCFSLLWTKLNFFNTSILKLSNRQTKNSHILVNEKYSTREYFSLCRQDIWWFKLMLMHLAKL